MDWNEQVTKKMYVALMLGVVGIIALSSFIAPYLASLIGLEEESSWSVGMLFGMLAYPPTAFLIIHLKI